MGKQQSSAPIQRAEQTLPANDIITAEMSAEALRAVCLHITENKGAESSRTLASLLRALYLDGSMFNFGSLDSLGPVSRRQAEILIRTRIWDVLPIDVLEQAYEMVREYEFPTGDPASGNLELGFEPDAVVLDEVVDEQMTGAEVDLPSASSSTPAKAQHLSLVTVPEAPKQAAEKSQKRNLGKTLLYAALSLSVILMVAFIFA
jgi:hypothetical protein